MRITGLILALLLFPVIAGSVEKTGPGTLVTDSSGYVIGRYVTAANAYMKEGYFFNLPTHYQDPNHEVYTGFTYKDEKCEKKPYYITGFPIENFIIKATADKIFATTDNVVQIKEGDTVYYEYFDMDGMKIKKRCQIQQFSGSTQSFIQEIKAIDKKEFMKKTGIDLAHKLKPPFRISMEK